MNLLALNRETEVCKLKYFNLRHLGSLKAHPILEFFLIENNITKKRKRHFNNNFP